jgi:small subunit ribosomal protein S1
MEEPKETQDMNAKANADTDTGTDTDARPIPGEDTGVETSADTEVDGAKDETVTADEAVEAEKEPEKDEAEQAKQEVETEAVEEAEEEAEKDTVEKAAEEVEKDTAEKAEEEVEKDTVEEAGEEAVKEIETDTEASAKTAPPVEEIETFTAVEIEEDESGDEFSEMMKDYDLKAAKAASRIDGKIIDIIDDKVVVDIGQKTEGILNIKELYDFDGSLRYKVGDTITVICKNINITEGYITVSKKQVDLQDGWQKVRRAYERKQPLTGRIVGVLDDNKGFKVDMGVEMFLPMSQADIKKIKSPPKLLGREFQFKVTRLNSREKNGVVSRRVILEEEKENKIKELFESLQVGDVVKGKVTSLTDYGAFVDIGGMDGLIHKDNISYARVNHPKEKLRKGDEVEAKVLEMDPEHKRISLGIKQRFPDPWIDIGKKYPVGKKLIAKVTKIVNFGAFIELEEGVEGLLHISDLTWEGKTNSVEEFVAVGERLWVQVIELNPEEKKIKLGLKQLEMRPEEKYIQKHKSGEIVKGLVKKILKSRVFVELEKGVEGVVKISDITYFRIDSPHEYLKEKETIDVMILSEALDPNYKVKLGIKQLSDPEWREYISQNKPGSPVPVKIKKVTDKGISVEISKNIEGFVRPNEIDDKKLEFEDIKKLFPSGKEIEAMILNADFDRKRIYLSFKALKRKREREDIDKYGKAASDSVTTIGDLFENAIDKKK